MNPVVPPTQTEILFRRYENAIRAALKAYPQPISFKTTRSVNTDTARCRDAIVSYRKYSWSVPDPDVFAAIKDPRFPLNTWNDGDKTYVGNRTVVFDKSRPEYEINSVSVADTGNKPIIIEPTSDDHVESLIKLIDDGVFLFPISLDLRWQDSVIRFVGDRLNVAYHVENPRIIIY